MTTNRRHPAASIGPGPSTDPGPATDPGPRTDPGLPMPAGDRIPAEPRPASHRDVRDAVLGYLGVAITGFVVPLEVYLVSTRRSAFAHQHAAEALRVSWAAVLYGICALIIGGMLALDSVTVAVIVVGPLALAFWLVLVVHLVRAARAAHRGEPPREFPGWLRVSARR
jgi:Domain of unknown function (DUF4870)